MRKKVIVSIVVVFVLLTGMTVGTHSSHHHEVLEEEEKSNLTSQVLVREDTAWISETIFATEGPAPARQLNVTPELPPFVDFHVTEKVITPTFVTPPPEYKKELNRTVKPPVAPKSTFVHSGSKKTKNETINLSTARTQSNDLFDIRQNATAGARSIVVFYEDFEGAFPGDNWTVGDGNPDSGEDYWDDTSYRSYGGYWSGYCADIGDTGANHKYDNNMYAFMIRKYVIDASKWISANLSFYTWYEIESGYDYLRVIVTGDGGSNWYEIGDKLDGSSGGWEYHSVSIPAEYLTSQFGIGFLFYSDSSVTYEGAYVDDIKLEAEVPGELSITGRWWCWISENTFTGGVRADVEVPLVWGTVWIWDGNNNFLGGRLTGSDGKFNITVTNPGATGFYVEILPHTSACNVTNQSGDNHYSGYTTMFYPSPDDTTYDIGEWIIPDYPDYRSAWRIYETIVNDYHDRGAWDFLVNEGPGYTPPKIHVIYPADGTYYNPGTPYCLYIGGENHTKALDTVQTGYGFFIMYMVYDLYYPDLDCPSPLYFNKHSSKNCSWVYGWAHFFPLAVQNEFYYEFGDGSYLDFEVPTWGTEGWDNGDDVIGRVIGALYDIFDFHDDGYDTFTDGFLNIWDVIYNQNDDDFSQFYVAWRGRGHDVPGANAAIYQNTIDYNNPPSKCTLSSPNGGGWYSGTITVSASDLSDDSGGYVDGVVSSVEYQASTDGNGWSYIGEDTSPSSTSSILWTTDTITPIIAAMACLTGGFDMPEGTAPDIGAIIDDECIGEKFLLNQYGGGIAYLGATRVAWWGGPDNCAGLVDKEFSRAITINDTVGEAWAYAIKREADRGFVNTSKFSRKTVTEYILLGDPSLRIGGVSSTGMESSSLGVSSSSFTPVIHKDVDMSPALAKLSELSNVTLKDAGVEVNLPYDWTDIGIFTMSEIGKPKVPYIVKEFKLPLGSEVESVTVELRNPVEIRNIFIEPTQPPVPVSRYWWRNNTSPPFTIDNRTYLSSNPYPGKEYEWDIYGRHRKEIVVRIFPIQYIPAENKVIAYKNATISISISSPLSASTPQPLGGGEEYKNVIITHPDFVDECERLAEWKNRTGLSTKVVDTTWINSNFGGFDGNDLQAKIKDFVDWSISNWGTTYITLVGDVDRVPTRYVYVNDSWGEWWDAIDGEYVPCDLYYIDLCDWDTNDDGLYGAMGPDVGTDVIKGRPEPGTSIGRLAASNEAELNILIDKIINYEADAYGSQWFKKVVLVASDECFDGSEDFNDEIAGYFTGWDIQKIYYGATHPVKDIQIAINKGCGFINYAGHGYYDSWSCAGFTNAKASSLVNVIKEDPTVWVRARAVDNLGEAGEWDTSDASFGIDNTDPGDWQYFSPSGWTNDQTPDCTIKVRDTASGLDVSTAYYKYSTNGGSTWNGWISATCTGSDSTTDYQTITASNVPFNQDSETQNKIKFKISDMAGNTVESSVYTVKIDATPPSASISINDGATYTNSTSVTLSLSYSDVLSGVKDCRYRNESCSWTGWESCVSTKSWELTSGDGEKTVYYQVRDYADNVKEVSDSIILDTTPPAITIHSPLNQTYNTTSLVLNVTTDEIADVWYDLNGQGNVSLYNDDTHGITAITAQEGANEVVVYAVDRAGNVNSTVRYFDVVVVNEPPNASFTYSPTFPTTADTVQFTDTSTDSDGWIEKWFWDFGDGNHSTLQNPTHQYAESGTYWVTLTVTDNDNATNSTSRKLVFSLADDFNDGDADGWDYNEDYWSVIGGEFVVNAPFGAAPGAWAGQECWSDYAVEADIMHTSLSKQRVDLVGRKTSGGFYAFEFYYHPSFTDRVALLKFDSSGARTIATGSFSFEPNVWYHRKMEFIGSKIKCYVNGTKVIETTDNSFSHGRTGFYVWNLGGESHFDNVVVTVYNVTNLEPTASFTYTPEFPLASDIINFTDLSTDPDGSIVEWHWDFGDGTNETITTPPANTTHQYAAVGTYTVTLTVRDNEGATKNMSKDIIVGVTLAEALDNTELNWATGGDTKWFGQTETYIYDNDSAQSAHIGNLQSTYIETNVTGPGNLSFYWKVSSESNYDFLRFYIDDIEQANISGEVDWHQMSFDIVRGNHTLKWAYTKDEYVKAGSDCGWLDKVVYAPSVTWGTPNINDRADDIVIDPATGDMYVLGGAGDPYGSVSYDVVIMKFDSSGNLLWKRTWGTEYHDIVYGMVLRNNTLFIAGWTHDSYYTKGDIFFLKVDATNGDIIDEKWFYTVVHSTYWHPEEGEHSFLGYEEMRSRIAVDYDRGYIYVPITSTGFCQGCGVYPRYEVCPDGYYWDSVDVNYTNSSSFELDIPPDLKPGSYGHSLIPDGVVLVFNLSNMDFLGYHAWSDETHIYIDGATVDPATGDLYMFGMLTYRTSPSSTHHGKIWRTPKGDELLSKNELWSPETWTYEEGRYFRWDEGVIIDNYLYLLGDGPSLRKIELSTMGVVWTYHFTGWWYASGIITDGAYLYVGGSDGYQEEGDAVIAKISKDGEFLGQWKVGNEEGNDGVEDVALRSDGSLTAVGHVSELTDGNDYMDAMLWFVQRDPSPPVAQW